MAVMKVIEILSESDKSWEDATQIGIAKASKSLKGIRSAWVQDQSVTVNEKGEVDKYRVSLKLSFEVM
ncbi:MAG: dodecin domain-containing protein [Saprospiraceae bacterium]|nr:dodecin domain-containing protein [Saprospiraceae bacterium]